MDKFPKLLKKYGFPYIKLEIEANTGLALYDDDEEEDANQRFAETSFFENFNRNKGVKFFNFYNDGSVNTELTITFDVDLIPEIPSLIRYFKEFTDYDNNENAGLHISVLTDSEYPGCNSAKYLREANLKNFKREVRKLLPAIYVLGSPRATTRGLSYRMPVISGDKYSAIHVLSTGFEYRVFDTCFDNPEDAMPAYIDTIVKTLAFYHDTDKHLPIDSARLEEAYMTNLQQNKNYMAGMFGTPEAYKIMREGLRYFARGVALREKILKDRRLGSLVDDKVLSRIELKMIKNYLRYVGDIRQASANEYAIIRDEIASAKRRINREVESYRQMTGTPIGDTVELKVDKNAIKRRIESVKNQPIPTLEQWLSESKQTNRHLIKIAGGEV